MITKQVLKFATIFLVNFSFAKECISQNRFKEVPVVFQKGTTSFKNGPVVGDTISSVDCTLRSKLLGDMHMLIADITVPQEAFEYDRISFYLAKDGEGFISKDTYKSAIGESNNDLKAKMTGKDYYRKAFSLKEYCEKEEYQARVFIAVQSIVGYEEKFEGNALVKKPLYGKAITIAQTKTILFGSKNK